jgi:hypothetical protein
LNHNLWALFPRLANIDENRIKESDTTLELQDMCTKGNQLFNNRPLNFITYSFNNARCNENQTIYFIFSLISQEHAYIITLSCFMYTMNWNSHYFGFNLVNHPITMWVLLMDLAWAWMLETISVTSSSNLDNWKFVKKLNRTKIAYIVANTFWTPTFWLIVQHLPLAHFVLNNSNMFIYKRNHVAIKGPHNFFEKTPKRPLKKTLV